MNRWIDLFNWIDLMNRSWQGQCLGRPKDPPQSQLEWVLTPLVNLGPTLTFLFRAVLREPCVGLRGRGPSSGQRRGWLSQACLGQNKQALCGHYFNEIIQSVLTCFLNTDKSAPKLQRGWWSWKGLIFPLPPGYKNKESWEDSYYLFFSFTQYHRIFPKGPEKRTSLRTNHFFKGCYSVFLIFIKQDGCKRPTETTRIARLTPESRFLVEAAGPSGGTAGRKGARRGHARQC